MIGWFDANLVSMIDGVAFGLLLFTLAVGLSLVFGMMDVLNLAHGTLYLAGAYTAYALSDGSWLGLLIALVVGLLVGVLGGGLLAAAVAPLQGRGHLDQAALTLGISFIVAEIFLMVFTAETLSTAPPAALDVSITVLGHTYPVYRLVFIVVAGVLAALICVMKPQFGLLLLWTAFQLARHRKHDPDIEHNPVLRLSRRILPVTTTFHGGKLIARIDGKRMVTPLFLVFVAIGSTDLLFALDSIPAVFGISQDVFIVFTANAFALLGLRALYFLVEGLLERLVYLSISGFSRSGLIDQLVFEGYTPAQAAYGADQAGL